MHITASGEIQDGSGRHLEYLLESQVIKLKFKAGGRQI